MSQEEKIQQVLEEKFPYLRAALIIKRQRRIFLDVAQESFQEVFDFARKTAGFSILCTITGMDEGEKFAVIYHLAREDGIVLNLRLRIGRDFPLIKTISAYFPAADIYERELEDLLGIKVEGLAEGPHYPLPDNWPKGEYPLRKDWHNNLAAGREEAKDA